MNDKQPEALRLADELEAESPLMVNTVAMLRTQHADLLRKDALLRQALAALDAVGKYVQDASVIDAITKELQ